jgi:hypothetical protein
VALVQARSGKRLCDNRTTDHPPGIASRIEVGCYFFISPSFADYGYDEGLDVVAPDLCTIIIAEKRLLVCRES